MSFSPELLAFLSLSSHPALLELLAWSFAWAFCLSMLPELFCLSSLLLKMSLAGNKYERFSPRALVGGMTFCPRARNRAVVIPNKDMRLLKLLRHQDCTALGTRYIREAARHKGDTGPTGIPAHAERPSNNTVSITRSITVHLRLRRPIRFTICTIHCTESSVLDLYEIKELLGLIRCPLQVLAVSSHRLCTVCTILCTAIFFSREQSKIGPMSVRILDPCHHSLVE